MNPNTGTKKFALRDPDGYYVMISALSSILTIQSSGRALGTPLIHSACTPRLVLLCDLNCALRSDRPTRANRVLDASVSSDRGGQRDGPFR